MTIEVVFTPAGLAKDEIAGKTVFVIDVLRATTTVCAALYNGARAVIPAPSIEEASRLAHTLGPEDVLLTGERNGLPIEGFALGNSPLEMSAEAVGGRTLVMTTSDGTGAVLATAGAAQVFLAGAVNFSLAAARARELLATETNLIVICAGRGGAFGLDDAYTAGRLVMAALDGKRSERLNDAALASIDLVRRYRERWARPLELSTAGRQLATAGLAGDVREAARQDRYPVLPMFNDRRIIAVPA